MKIVAILECANGNESVGTQWSECLVVDSSASVESVIQWRQAVKERRGISSVGTLSLVVAESREPMPQPQQN